MVWQLGANQPWHPCHFRVRFPVSPPSETGFVALATVRRGCEMKPIFKEIRDAANDENLSDAAFRLMIRETFDKRIHDESILMSFLRAKDVAKARESK